MNFAVVVEEALEADHATSRPYLICTIAPGRDEIDLIARGRLGEERRYGAVTGFILGSSPCPAIRSGPYCRI
jgi:hypothetical protein